MAEYRITGEVEALNKTSVRIYIREARLDDDGDYFDVDEDFTLRLTVFGPKGQQALRAAYEDSEEFVDVFCRTDVLDDYE